MCVAGVDPGICNGGGGGVATGGGLDVAYDRPSKARRSHTALPEDFEFWGQLECVCVCVWGGGGVNSMYVYFYVSMYQYYDLSLTSHSRVPVEEHNLGQPHIASVQNDSLCSVILAGVPLKLDVPPLLPVREETARL